MLSRCTVDRKSIPPKPASTVILSRLPDGGSPEIFLVKRHGRSGFMAGAHVFPGGRVDDSDADWNEALTTDRANPIWTANEDPAESIPFIIAAIRETAEECGVFLAADENQNHVSPKLAQDLFTKLKSGTSFTNLMQLHGLQPCLHDCTPFSWWVTPEDEPRRYDTRFFAAVVPEGQRAGFDEHEVVDGAWFTPESALAAYQEGSILLAPPTFATLEDLRGIRTFEDLQTRAQAPLEPISPILTADETSDFVLALPGDRLHPSPCTDSNSPRTRIFFNNKSLFQSAKCPASQ
jgi:8-oxo-dGTP pyrophosphatase MutT (NUDIX family)